MKIEKAKKKGKKKRTICDIVNAYSSPQNQLCKYRNFLTCNGY